MFEQVTPSVRVAKAGTGIGVVTHGDRALLVDSGAGRAPARPRLARFARCGLDENLARKVVNALANEGVSVAAIVNTRAHADHIGAGRVRGRAAARLGRVRASWSAARAAGGVV